MVVVVWACIAASGPGQLAIIDGTMNLTLPENPKRVFLLISPSQSEARAQLGCAARQRSEAQRIWLQLLLLKVAQPVIKFQLN